MIRHIPTEQTAELVQYPPKTPSIDAEGQKRNFTSVQTINRMAAQQECQNATSICCGLIDYYSTCIGRRSIGPLVSRQSKFRGSSRVTGGATLLLD